MGKIKINKELIILVLILIVGAFLRLYKIDQYLTFLGDEGRDVIVVRRLLTQGDLILIGPGTSIGNMYLGPLYYYMMAPALFLANYSPVGPAVMIALLGVMTIWFIWYVGKRWFETTAGLIGAGLYAISPVVINYSRSSWNPNIMPFFALISVWGMWQVWRNKKYVWLPVVGVSFAFALQSHYLGLLLGPTLFILWILTLLKCLNMKRFLLFSAVALAFFSFLMSPLVIFDARHGWRNFAAMKTFFTNRQETVSARPWNSLSKIAPMSQKIVTRLVAATNKTAGMVTSVLFALGLGWLLLIKREKFQEDKIGAYFVLLLWLGFALIGLGLYKQEIYDHYYGFFFPAPFILLGALVSELKSKSFGIWALSLGFLGVLVFINLYNTPLKYSPNRQLARSIEVAAKIEEVAGGKKFNFAVIAERNYEGAYQYFLERDNAPFVIIDALRTKETIQDQLFVVCELSPEKCDPTHNSKAEIANFGWSAIDSQWSVAGVTLFKLVHTK